MAAAALIFWPLIGLIIFISLGPARGLIWTAMVGYLFLPEAFGFDLPGLPPYDKTTALTLSLLLPGMIYWRRVPGVSAGGNRLPMFLLSLCLAIYVLSAFGTLFTNRFPIAIGESFRQAITFRDVISMTSEAVFFLTPAVLAWRFLRGTEAQYALLNAVVVLALFYSLLVLFEWRMSPQLHNWVYGYFPHDWLQHLRGNGFRPVVFLSHGLSVGFFLYIAVVAAAAMAWQSRKALRAVYGVAAAWLFLVLLLSYNFGATMLALIFVPVLLLLSRRLQLWIVTAVAVLILIFPAVRDAATGPLNTFVVQIEKIAPERASSFDFRLANERALLDRASQKPLFGWGGWSRARVFDERGRDTSVSDGLWIIVKGERGWIGYLAFFGLMATSFFFLGSARQKGKLEPATIGIAVILAGNLIYIIPNSSISPVSLLMFGALAGFVTRGIADDAGVKTDSLIDDPPHRELVRLTRFPGGLAPDNRASVSNNVLLRKTGSGPAPYRRDPSPKDA